MNNYYNGSFDESNNAYDFLGKNHGPISPYPIKPPMPNMPPFVDGPMNPPTMPMDANISPTIQSPLYTPGFLAENIGREMRVEFLIGSTGPLVDRIGTLIGVGISYILLNPVNSNDVLLCDIYSIKFVSILI